MYTVGHTMADICLLISRYRSGDKDSFLEIATQYTPMIESAARRLSLEPEDILSDALMALYRAVMTFDTEQTKVTFGLYAQICVTNALHDYLRHQSASSRISDGTDIDDIASDADIAEELVRREESELLYKSAKRILSDYEYKVMIMWLGGASATDISCELMVSTKSVENAKARIFKKLRALGLNEH